MEVVISRVDSCSFPNTSKQIHKHWSISTALLSVKTLTTTAHTSRNPRFMHAFSAIPGFPSNRQTPRSVHVEGSAHAHFCNTRSRALQRPKGSLCVCFCSFYIANESGLFYCREYITNLFSVFLAGQDLRPGHNFKFTCTHLKATSLHQSNKPQNYELDK